mgnify:CR=1 FL=1
MLITLNAGPSETKAMSGRDDVCVLIPTLNEAETIGDVVSTFQALDFDHILVIDGNSTDRTREIASEHGAEVTVQSGSGKGQAVREALLQIDHDVVVLIDGDGTYRPEDAEDLLAPILDGVADHVVGNRFADIHDGAMTRFNQFGNRAINRVFRTIHGQGYVDILSGYRAFTREALSQLRLTEDGFGIEAQMSVESVKHEIPTAVVPISYLPRPSGSDPNLRPIRDGSIIILTLYRLAKTNNPLFYWGLLGGLAMLASVGLGGFVAYEWLFRGIDHQVLATAAAFGMLFGGELVLFGILSDMIIALHRELLRNL